MSDQNPIGPRKDAQPRYWETSDFWKDAGERIVTTYLFAFAGAMTLAGFDFTNGKAWAGAGVAAALSTIKAIIGAQRTGSTTPVSII